MHDQDVHALSSRWAELYNQGDFQGVADLCTEDGIVFNVNGRADVGRQAIYDSIALALREPMDQVTIEVTTEEAEVFGDKAYGMGSYVFSAPDGSIRMQGTYMAISKLIDGEWKLHRHIVNRLLPKPEADAP